LLPADDEQDEILAAGGVRDLAGSRRLDVEEPARAELAHLALDFDARPAAVHEVELVLEVVVVAEALEAGRHHHRVDAERGDAQRAPDPPKAVPLPKLLNRTKGVRHSLMLRARETGGGRLRRPEPRRAKSRASAGTGAHG